VLFQPKPRINDLADDERLSNSLAALGGHRRDAILEATAASAKELLRASDLDISLPRVVECVGPAAGADRLNILLQRSGDSQRDASSVFGKYYAWNASGIWSLPDDGPASWTPILMGGNVIVGKTGDFDSHVRKCLQLSGVKSVLRVPIFAEGAWCGFIGFDYCRAERDWSPSEIEIIKILAELIGSAIVSSGRMQVLEIANRVVETSPTILYRLGPQPPFPLVFVSKNIKRYGYDAVELLETPDRWPQLIHRDDIAIAVADLTELAEGKRDFSRREIRLMKPDGSSNWFEGRTVRLCDDTGRLIALEGLMTDVAARKQMEQELAASHVLLTAAIENSPDAILVVDQNGRVTTLNRHFIEMWHVSPELIAAQDHAQVLDFAASLVKNKQDFIVRVRTLYSDQNTFGQDEFETMDGRTIERHSAPLHDGQRQYLGRIWFFRDITKRKMAEQTIIELASIDSLTGLANRSAFMERLRLVFARTKHGAKPFAVLYLDLDHFKDVNDTLGHPAGDALLKIVADRLKTCVRETDMIARFGGDEFAVLQEDVSNHADSEALAAKICLSIASSLSIAGNQTHSTASVGIVPYDADIADPEAMMSKADLALYRAKNEGRDRFRFHIRELDEKVRERVIIGEGLHSAIENDELELYYQPQMELKSGRLVGLEALVRWNHPMRGMLLPDQFIPIAELNGSILRLGQWIIERTCRQIRDWHQQQIAPRTVAVNVSAGQFKLASNLDRVIADALAKYSVTSDQLELELTESVLMEATRRHSEELERLRHIGLRIVIDDFGTGYSSLDYLRSFRVSRLKIDRRFVSGVTVNADDATIVRAVIGLAQALGIEVVAEGIETSEQRAFLLSNGCLTGQGYLFGKPISSTAATALLRHKLGRRFADISSPAQGSVYPDNPKRKQKISGCN
jgi:diguanylate cyclase (GGDEF)-like protein/PAS domain S-box-containing protein